MLANVNAASLRTQGLIAAFTAVAIVVTLAISICQLMRSLANDVPWNPPATIDLVAQEQPHFYKFYRWPILVVLMFASFPAGMSPFLAAGAFNEMRIDRQAPPKWRNEKRIESGLHMVMLLAGVWAMISLIHLALALLAYRKWNRRLLSLRGGVWWTMLWSAYGLGAIAGVWIFLAMPEY
jgi:hypothetical protein